MAHIIKNIKPFIGHHCETTATGTLKELEKILTSKIMALQDENGCWNVVREGDKYFTIPAFHYYVPNFKSTLWTLVFLADIQTDIENKSFLKPLEVITNHFFDKESGICSIGKSHFPIPCLNGNMLYLHNYFNSGNVSVVDSIVDFFAEYQRFDDGDFKSPSSFPYRSNRSCYGKHTCYWGVIKLLKGLSFIPVNKRSENAKMLIKKCIDFVLLHEVCFSSHNLSQYIHPSIQSLSFPNMYHGDFLEILCLLKREQVNSIHMNRALDLLREIMKPDSTWEIEHPLKNLIIPFGNKNYGNEFITRRAKEVMDYYQK